MALDLNRPPYYADFDPEKNYYKYVFLPRRPIQAREATGIQDLLQNQIKKFGQHIFQEGSIVLGGGFDYEQNISYIKASALANTVTDVTSFENMFITGTTSTVKAFVRKVEYDEDNNWYVFFVRYTMSSNTNDTFLTSETVQVEGDPTLSFTTASSNAAGQGSIFSISEGVVFRDGYFLSFPHQTVVLEKYSTTPSVTVGFKTEHSIITEFENSSLADNALGYSNKNAPGAHRLNIEAVLTRLPYGEGNDDPEFTELISIKNGIVESREERTQYSRLYEELAKRTFDESGDYYVNGLGAVTREHLDTGTNEGLYFANAGGNANLISIEIDPGVAYVKGYEKNILTTQHIITDKSTTFNYVNESFVNATTGGYLVLKEISGHPILDVGTQINLYNAAETRITSKTPITTAPGGTILGTARVKAIQYDSGTLGNPTATMRIYLFDIKMTAGLFSAVRGVGINGSFFGDVVLTGGVAALQEPSKNLLIFPMGSDHTKSLRDNTGTCETSFLFYRTDDSKTIEFSPNTGTYSVSVAITGEEIPYSGSLTAQQKRELILSVKAAKDFELPGTVSNSTLSTLTGTGTQFTRLNVGDRIKANNVLYYVNSIANSTQLTIVGSFSAAVSGNRIYRSYLAGDVIDLTVNGSSGAVRTADCTAGTLTIDVKEDVTSNATLADGTLSARLTFPVRRSGANATEIDKTLLPNRYVKIDCTGFNANQLAAPVSLGIPDVYQIREIRKHTSTFTTGLEGSDVTDQFIFDNGQRDNHYDLATIRGPIANTDHLLVKLDHFDSSFASGVGYFSVDSYPIDDTTVSNTTIFTYQIPTYISSTGTTYNLRNCMDFRPYVSNTANSSTTIAAATTNPAAASALKSDGVGLRIPVPDSTINLDYAYYLARRDIVVLDIDGNLSVIKGSPAISPVSPPVPENVMALAKVFIPPYPSITETLGRIEGIKTNICTTTKLASPRLTQRELNVMKDRIDTLDYYNALNLLEKRANDLKIIDPATGLDRFKNGFFVDGFLDHSLGETSNPDYHIAVDRTEQCIRPVFKMDAFRYKLEANGTSGVQQTGPLITLPYTETVLLDQPAVSTIRNIEQSVYRYIGTIEPTPAGDVWTDTKTVTKVIDFGNGNDTETIMNTEWGSWQTYGAGIDVYSRNKLGPGGVATYVGRFYSVEQALAVAKSVNLGIAYAVGDTRTGIQTTIGTETKTENIGNFVTDASLATYIRPQTIELKVRGLKARTRYYVFFDGELMSTYLTPKTVPAGGFAAATTYLSEGAAWRSNDYGELLGYLRLPATGKRFRTGTKEIMITDSPTNDPETTSFARYYWTALGLNAQKQNTILSTQIPVIIKEQVQETRAKQQLVWCGPSCMAYTFKVDVPPGEEGIFLTSVDVFIAAMHPSLGVWFEIREMNSAGGITRTQVPFSEVWMERDDPRIQVSDNPNNILATNVNFPAPVFLYNNTQYAFVIHTEGLNPDTYFWVSRLGQKDVRTGQQITSRKLTGTLYTTNNNLDYDMVPDVDLMVRFKRAQFTNGATGTAILGNNPTEFITMSNTSGNFIRAGEIFKGSNKLTLSNIVGANGIANGDILYGVTSNTTANVVTIGGSIYYTDGFTYTVNEGITVKFANGVNKGVTANVATINSGNGTLRSYDANTSTIIIDDSNGHYFANCIIKGDISGDTAKVTSFGVFPYSAITTKPHSLKFSKTDLLFTKRGYREDTLAFGDWYDGIPDNISEFDEETAMLSRATEIASLSSQSSAQLKGQLTTYTEYLSPAIDVSRANAIYVHNLINNDSTGEANAPSGGNALNKYISKMVTLADGQDAEDVVVRLTAYRPPNSTVKVYYKIKHEEDGDLFDEKNWIEMEGPDTYSAKANRYNYIDMDFAVPAAQLTSGVTTYQSDGNTFLGFKQFAVKIVLLGTNSAIVPKVADLRVVAAQA